MREWISALRLRYALRTPSRSARPERIWLSAQVGLLKWTMSVP